MLTNRRASDGESRAAATGLASLPARKISRGATDPAGDVYCSVIYIPSWTAADLACFPDMVDRASDGISA